MLSCVLSPIVYPLAGLAIASLLAFLFPGHLPLRVPDFMKRNGAFVPMRKYEIKTRMSYELLISAILVNFS